MHGNEVGHCFAFQIQRRSLCIMSPGFCKARCGEPFAPTAVTTHAIAAEMPKHSPSRISIPICILLHKFLAALEFYLCLTETVVMRKRRASRALAIDAVAMHREFIDPCHGERDFSAVAAD